MVSIEGHCLDRVKLGRAAMSAECPVFPRKRKSIRLSCDVADVPTTVIGAHSIISSARLGTRDFA